MVNKPGNRSHIQKYPEHSSSVFGRVNLDDISLQQIQDANSRAIKLLSEIPSYQFGFPTKIQQEDYDANIKELVRVDPSEGEVDIRLPKITEKMSGGLITIINITDSPNNINIIGADGDKIDGASSQLISSAYGVMTVIVGNKTQWIRL